MNADTKVIIFDLGGVVVRWVGIQALSDLTGFSVSQISEKFKASDIGNQFERGLCPNDQFVSEFRTVFNLTGPDRDLIDLWNSWVKAPYPGIVAAIEKLQASYRIACLSNTNDLHWEHLKTYLNVDNLFAPAYASHEIHLAKPDTDCFDFVTNNLDVSPEEILFLDDTQANVDAALTAGWQAVKVDPKFGALPVLKALELI